MRAYIFISVDNSKNRIIKIGIFDVIREIESIIDDYFGSDYYTEDINHTTYYYGDLEIRIQIMLPTKVNSLFFPCFLLVILLIIMLISFSFFCVFMSSNNS